MKVREKHLSARLRLDEVNLPLVTKLLAKDTVLLAVLNEATESKGRVSKCMQKTVNMSDGFHVRIKAEGTDFATSYRARMSTGSQFCSISYIYDHNKKSSVPKYYRCIYATRNHSIHKLIILCYLLSTGQQVWKS